MVMSDLIADARNTFALFSLVDDSRGAFITRYGCPLFHALSDDAC